MAYQNNEITDATSLEDFSKNDYAIAEHILESRSGTSSSSSILPKGGVKYSENHGTNEEHRQLQEYYKATENVLSSWKVRKLSNLGLAEWLPKLNVAKVIIQGKFMQTKGFPHHDGFFALFPEEALFLLDVGDIELKYKGALLSLQDAFCLLTSNNCGGSLCNLDEYHVYAHLSRMGYRVQRHSMSSDTETSDIDKSGSEDDASTSKRQLKNHSEELSREECKRSKLSAGQKPMFCTSKEINFDAENFSIRKSDELYRSWWLIVPEKNDFSEQLKSTTKVSSPNSSSEHLKSEPNLVTLSGAYIPNLAKHINGNLILKQAKSLIPPMTSSDDLTIAEVWYQRLNKDDRSPCLRRKKIYSNSKHVDYDHIFKKVTNWTHYKSLVSCEQKEIEANLRNLCQTMHSGEIKPLVHPQFACNNKVLHENLKIFEEEVNLQNQDNVSSFTIRYNVFQHDRTKVFRKTQPGTPFLRIIVANSNNPPPSLSDISDFNYKSDGVPVKIALVDSGQIMFFGFDSFSIPTDIFQK